MTAIFPTSSKQALLELIVGIRNSAPTLHLFTNPLPNDITLTINNFQEPGGSYTARVLDTSNWFFSSTTEPPVIAYPNQIFSFTGWTGTVYGYFIKNPSAHPSTQLLWYENLTAFPVTSPGDTIQLQLRLSLDDL